LGVAYNLGTKHNFVIRAGFGLFHGIIPAPLLACQLPSCGGTIGKYPGRPFENNLDAKTELFAFASSPAITALGLEGLVKDGAYPDNTTDPFTNPFPGCTPITNCAFFGPSVVVRFDQNHQNPYGIQASAAIEFDPLPDTAVSISGLHIRGVHLGSFFNVNQPDPTAQVTAFDSQDSQNFRAERALSSDDVRNRLVFNGTVTTPKEWNVFARNFEAGMIATIQSPMRFTKFAGFDANGDIFGNNDRVGIEPRNTFVGDNFRSADFRLGRTFPFKERRSLEVLRSEE